MSVSLSAQWHTGVQIILSFCPIILSSRNEQVQQINAEKLRTNENESVFFLNFSSAPCPLNEDIMARVKHVIGETEEGGQASVPSLDEGIKARSLGNDL
jgi:hypothetical protein